GAHTYADDGQYTVGVSINDVGGSTASANSTATVAHTAVYLTVNGNSTTPIGAAQAGNVSLTVTGLDSDDTGTVTFTDANSNILPVNVDGTQTNYMADLTTLADGQITSTLSVKTDPGGSSLAPIAGNTVTLDTDKAMSPALSFIGPVIDAAADK